jgi:hypothetical protein
LKDFSAWLVAFDLLSVQPEEHNGMLATINESQTAYAVEVSGWDSNENFFVEKTALQWADEPAKLIEMTHAISSGALLFLRLLDPTSVDRVHPVPYVAERVEVGDDGHFKVELSPARLRGQ